MTEEQKTEIENIKPRLQQLIIQDIAIKETQKTLLEERKTIEAEIKLLMRESGKERLEDTYGNLVTYKEQSRTSLKNEIAIKELGQERFNELASVSTFSTLKVSSAETRKKSQFVEKN